MEFKKVSQTSFFWALQTLCTVHRRPFSLALAQQQSAAPYTAGMFLRVCTWFDFDAVPKRLNLDKLRKESFPLVVWLQAPEVEELRAALLIQAVAIILLIV
jgi:subfamily B ATP-binding cassette protein HlyB/CyaB